MNIGVMLDESPTSTHFGSNALSLACYPVHCDFCLDDNKIYHSAICFISDDMSHDYEQVEQFEKRLVDIHRDKFGMEVKYWVRDSEGCQGEFKSQKTVLKLAEAPINVLNLDKDETDFKVDFNFFESHEGKNKSDGIGSLVKMYLERRIRKESNVKI